MSACFGDYSTFVVRDLGLAVVNALKSVFSGAVNVLFLRFVKREYPSSRGRCSQNRGNGSFSVRSESLNLSLSLLDVP
jgi:hypothetical protein